MCPERLEYQMAMMAAMSMTMTMATIVGDILRYWIMMGAARSETRLITLIIGLRAGPEVSLRGSPTVSPTTAALCASDPFPPKRPSSIS